MLPEINNYGQYSSDNYGYHTLRLNIAGHTIWYSYSTIIAFRELGHSKRVSVNQWTVTTGKHLNWIDGGNKKERIPAKEFNTQLNDFLSRNKLI